MLRRRVWPGVALAVSLLLPPPTRVGGQQPADALRAGTDLVTIDVQVSSAGDGPIRELRAADFAITIAGRGRTAASATLLHHDEGTVLRDPPVVRADQPPACIFGFHRKTDRRTAHYLVGVDRTDADRKEVKGVRVTIVDRTLAVQWFVWRSPIR